MYFFLVIYLEVKFLAYMFSILSILSNCFSQGAVPFTFLWAMDEDSNFYAFSWVLLLSTLFKKNYSYLSGCEVRACGLDLHFPND